MSSKELQMEYDHYNYLNNEKWKFNLPIYKKAPLQKSLIHLKSLLLLQIIIMNPIWKRCLIH